MEGLLDDKAVRAAVMGVIRTNQREGEAAEWGSATTAPGTSANDGDEQGFAAVSQERAKTNFFMDQEI